MRKLFIIFILCSIAALPAAGQKVIEDKEGSDKPQKEHPRYGLFGDFNLNYHKASLLGSQVGVTTCCPGFEDGDGTGFSFGALYEHPIAENLFIALRAGWIGYNAELSKEEPEIFYNYAADEIASGVINHKLDHNLSVITLEPMVQYRVFADLFAHAGASFSVVNITKDFDHIEEISEPAFGLFENGQRERLRQSSEFENISSFGAALMAGLSYEIPLTSDKKFILAPEAFFLYGLTDIAEDTSWKANQLRLGLSLKYMPFSESAIPDDVLLTGDVSAIGLFEGGIEKPVIEIQVEEFLQTRLKPLLGYVFFDENSSELPGRYESLTPEQAEGFFVENMHESGTIETYYNVLNIIGRRMVENPEARIVIEGCNSNSGAEEGNTGLSRARAEIVRDYLQDTWGITVDRMVLSDRNLPANPSRTTDQDGVEENRRVEISSVNPAILAPVISEDTLRRTTPPAVKFIPVAEASEGLKNWAIAANQRGEMLADFTGGPPLPDNVIWEIEKNQNKIPTEGASLEYNISLIDNKGNVFTSPNKNLPVESLTITKKRRMKIADRYIDKYSLILFDYNKAGLDERHLRITDFIKDRVYPNSEITVEGYTDRLGEEGYNMTLSENRAEAAAGQFSGNVSAIGHGEDVRTYDNSKPEGRFYSRRVDITVVTPDEEQ